MKNTLESDIVDALYKHGEMSRTQLVNVLNVPWTTMYDHLIRLMKDNIITNRRVPCGQGRPTTLWFIGIKEEHTDEWKKIQLLKEIQNGLHIPTHEILWMELEEVIDKLTEEVKSVSK